MIRRYKYTFAVLGGIAAGACFLGFMYLVGVALS